MAKDHLTLADVLRDRKAELEQEFLLLGLLPSFSSADKKALYGMTESSLRSMAAQLDGKLASIIAAIEQCRQEAAAITARPTCWQQQFQCWTE